MQCVGPTGLKKVLTRLMRFGVFDHSGCLEATIRSSATYETVLGQHLEAVVLQGGWGQFMGRSASVVFQVCGPSVVITNIMENDHDDVEDDN